MKRGMSKREAKERIITGEFTWDDLRQMLVDAHPTLKGEAGEARSRVNKSLSLAVSFNIHWRAIRGRTGKICRDTDVLGAANLVREFGNSNNTPKWRKELPRIAHQKLIDIHDDAPPLLKYWTRNNAKRRWESKDGQWFAYDQWSCGRITQMRPDQDTEDNPAWCEIYEFAKSQTASRVTDGRQ